MEVKFEDFEADAMGMTETIYKSLSISWICRST